MRYTLVVLCLICFLFRSTPAAAETVSRSGNLADVLVSPPPAGSFAPVQVAGHCPICPQPGRFDHDLGQVFVMFLAANSAYPDVRHGFWEPEGRRWKDHVENYTLYDHDKPRTDAVIHPLAATGLYLMLRHRGYSRFQATTFLFLSLTLRELAIKAWGKPPTLDDPLIFASSGLFFGTLVEEYTPLDDYTRWIEFDRYLPKGVHSHWSPTGIALTW